MSITKQLDKLMTRKGINKSQLAKESGVPYTTIQGLYAKGDENIKLSTMIKLADYFECSLDYLVEYQPKIVQRGFSDWTAEELRELANFESYLLSKRHLNDKLNIKGGKSWEEKPTVEADRFFGMRTDGEDKYR